MKIPKTLRYIKKDEEWMAPPGFPLEFLAHSLLGGTIIPELERAMEYEDGLEVLDLPPTLVYIPPPGEDGPSHGSCVVFPTGEAPLTKKDRLRQRRFLNYFLTPIGRAGGDLILLRPSDYFGGDSYHIDIWFLRLGRGGVSTVHFCLTFQTDFLGRPKKFDGYRQPPLHPQEASNLFAEIKKGWDPRQMFLDRPTLRSYYKRRHGLRGARRAIILPPSSEAWKFKPLEAIVH